MKNFLNHIISCRKYMFATLIFLIILTISESVISQQLPEPPSGLMAGQAVAPGVSKEPGLLFYLSGNYGFKADFAAGGQVLPNYLRNVSIIKDGINGSGFSAEDNQLLSYFAPGNIYGQRGTLSFFWRSRYPVGRSEFPVFRVAYADHSSWDMVWLRIDYNGSGFDAFVTDIGLSRLRVSYFTDKFPGPDEWTHIALSWDETEGIKFYINGYLAAKQLVTGLILDAGLDQFGPHSRIISPYQVQSEYSFQRGGDIDEIRIYDRMLTDENISLLSKGKGAGIVLPVKRDLSNVRWRDEWWKRNGWNIPNPPPPLLTDEKTYIRKVEIHDAYDIKRWYWKANDGIRETTWPGVYNMSRLPGRYDYFVLPDWDCYSGSGQSIRFILPDELWNHVEIWGKAWGQLTFENDQQYDHTFGSRTVNQVKSVHRLSDVKTGGVIRYDNAIIEEPIGSFDVYYTKSDDILTGQKKEGFTISIPGKIDSKPMNDVLAFIRGRYPADEQAFMVGIPEVSTAPAKKILQASTSLPLIHILIPYSCPADQGLDGLEIQLPPLPVKPTHGSLFPLNIRIKDPLWQMRDLADFSFSVLPGTKRTLRFDIRDRILPAGRVLYLTVSGGGQDLTPALLDGMKVSLLYKSRDIARKEHEADRFIQVKDLYGHVVEEHPRSPRLNLYNRLMADITDLLDVNPDHWLAKTYYYAITGKNKPEYTIPTCPEHIPEWAFLQVEYMKHLERLLMHYIDNRQIGNGEFGGGLSDDGDFTNMFPALAFLGIEPEKVLTSLKLHMSAYYDQDRPSYDASLRQRSLPLFTNGLSTIFTDELHAYEEGIEVVGQLQLLDYGNPLYMERGMETALRVLNDVTQINPAGHRHIRSRNYGGTRMATEDPWQWSVPNSYHVLHTAYMTALYNGNKNLIKMITELADGLLEHYRDGEYYNEIHFESDADRGTPGIQRTWQVFYAAYILTGDKKYLNPIEGRLSRPRGFNRDTIISRYRDEIQNLGINEYINIHGSTWIDRISASSSVIQQDRLGGMAIARISTIIPRHFVSWTFRKPASFKSTAIYLPVAEPSEIEVIAYNLDPVTVNADMTVWGIEPGLWRLSHGTDTNNNQVADKEISVSMHYLRKGDKINLSFIPGFNNILNLKLINKAEKENSELPDLAIGPDDIKIDAQGISVCIHNLGAAGTVPVQIDLQDSAGRTLNSARIPDIEAPDDLYPQKKEVVLKIPDGRDLTHGKIIIDPKNEMEEITKRNNIISW